MMRQYLEQKALYPDCILFFRLGDFYEMFFEDAETASGILDIALTSRSKGEDAIPMCGVPHFSASTYIAKLIERGHKVAVCDQIEDASKAKGIVKRAVTRVVSPGMITEPDDLDARESNYLAGLTGNGPYGFAFLDVSTADFQMTEIDSPDAALDELARVRPRELLLPAGFEGSVLHSQIQKRHKDVFIKLLDAEAPAVREQRSFEQQFSAQDLQASGCAEGTACLAAARLVFSYAASSLPGSLDHLRRLVPYDAGEHLVVDEFSRTNLELVRTIMDGSRRGSLLGVIDRTRTSMGARLLARWLIFPLVDPDAIARRADAVEQLVEGGVGREDLASSLTGIRDMERLLSKATVGQASPRDLGALRDSLARLPGWARTVAGSADNPAGPLESLLGPIDVMAELCANLDAALADELPADAGTGGSIRPGYDEKLDELVDLASSGREKIARMEAEQREQTGIGSLKIRYNKVFGYYIEVTRPNLHLVPESYRRKQTTANAERFETEELKTLEERILRAHDDRLELEQQILAELVGRLRDAADRILRVAHQVAQSDVVSGLADLAASANYCRPVVDDSCRIEISDGRHPVVEQLMRDERFVPNDVSVDCSAEQLLIITGPNMAGKSTTIRQVALIAILAQMGSFVPAASAHIGVVDRIFTRIGAADNLARGQSTFMVEMIETAHILLHATRRSLLVLDEIGRGTSTFDGLSIAWSVAEYIHDRICARTLFATHYHQLADLSLTKERVVNYTISVKEWNDQIIFLRRLVRGVTSRSYGVQVGKLAGLPAAVISRAREVLANLERQEFDEIGAPRLSRSTQAASATSSGQLQLFAPPARSTIEVELQALNPDELTPLEALELLHRWKEKLP